jgi:uncharacterized protein YuzE
MHPFPHRYRAEAAGPAQGHDPQRLPGSAVQAMKLNYYPDTDSLYIDLSEETSVESREISAGVVLDYDAEGNLVGIDIDNASAKVDLHKVTVSKLPGSVETVPGERAR